MKRRLCMMCGILALVLLTGCASGDIPLETWDIEYREIGDQLYARGYDSIDEVLEDSVLIVRARPTALIEELRVGVWLELEVLESSCPGLETIELLQLKNPDFLLLNGQEAVLILKSDGLEEGRYYVPNDTCGLFVEDPETGDMTGELLESLIEDAPAAYSANGGADLSLEEVFDLLVDKSSAFE